MHNEQIGSTGVNPYYQAWASSSEAPKVSPSELDTVHIAERFITAHLRGLSEFAGDSSLRYEVQEQGKTFAFYPREKKVKLPAKWFDGEYSDGELVFSSFHELAHFIDMRKNPEEYLKNFERLEEKAENLAKQYCQKYPSQASIGAVKKFYYDELHTLYNCLDDIYVNALVKYKAPKYGNSYGGEEVISLYRKLGFGGADSKEQPLHMQMTYALLRDAMVGDKLGKSEVVPEVAETLDKRHNKRSIRDRVTQDLRPKGGILVDPAERYQMIRDIIEPEYLRLLEKALDDFNNQRNDNSGKSDDSQEADNQEGDGSESGLGNQFNKSEGSKSQPNDDFSPFGRQDNMGNDFFNNGDEESTKKMIEDFAEEDKVRRMSPFERSEYNKQKAQAKFDKEHNIEPNVREEFERTKSKIGKARREMQDFWNSLIGKSIEFERHIISEQRQGKLNIGSVIKNYPDFVDAMYSGNLDELNIYDKSELERILVDKPEAIEITLLVDGSGSMSGDRIEMARAAATLMMLSIKDFNEELEYKRRETHSKLHANTEVIMYGSDFERIKEFEKNVDYNNSLGEAEIVKSVSNMVSNYGGTDDSAPLQELEQGLTHEQREQIKQGKLVKIIFEITDGGSQSKRASRLNVQKLMQSGVLMFAFQIGDVDEREKDTFGYIWNNNNDGKERGISIGDSEITSLPHKLIAALKETLKDIRI